MQKYEYQEYYEPLELEAYKKSAFGLLDDSDTDSDNSKTYMIQSKTTKKMKTHGSSSLRPIDLHKELPGFAKISNYHSTMIDDAENIDHVFSNFDVRDLSCTQPMIGKKKGLSDHCLLRMEFVGC